MKIKMEYDDAFDCLDNVIVNLLKWNECSFETLYAYSWNFRYCKVENEDQTIGSNLSSNRKYRWDYLEKYHGARITFYKNVDKKLMIREIKKIVNNGNVVIIGTDIYWCPWYKSAYKKYKADHFCLIVDIENNDFVVQDAQLAVDGQILPYSDLESGITTYAVLNIINKREVGIARYKEVLKESVQCILCGDDSSCMFEDISLLSEDIKFKLDFSKEIVGYEDRPYQSELFQRIYNIGRGRIQYALFLEYLHKHSSDIVVLEIAKKIKKIGEKWTSIFGLLCKSHCMGGDRGAALSLRVGDKISILMNDEQKVLDAILYIVDSDGKDDVYKIESENRDNNIIISDYFFVDLSKYFNCKSISPVLTNNTRAEITSEKRYILGDKIMNKNEWAIGRAQYLFPNIQDEKLDDNVSCNGEEIRLDLIRCSCIMLLGCAELGNHIDNLEIEFEDGEKEIIECEFTSWLSAPVFGEAVAWKGKGVERIGEEVFTYPFNVYLFSREVVLNKVSKVRSIKLPPCPNIHIFAITLAN